MAVSTLAAEIAQGDVTAAAAEERAKFQRHFARFDMLFFASGEPTIHPKLFDWHQCHARAQLGCLGQRQN